eukprot:GHVU01150260.1.p1 GENE.GHVU01150260.1~~GHVU01150260.1.p1  ORF type:complete len:143 (+),score=10.93 GHVU01150260.1:430-858(+)
MYVYIPPEILGDAELEDALLLIGPAFSRALARLVHDTVEAPSGGGPYTEGQTETDRQAGTSGVSQAGSWSSGRNASIYKSRVVSSSPKVRRHQILPASFGELMEEKSVQLDTKVGCSIYAVQVEGNEIAYGLSTLTDLTHYK